MEGEFRLIEREEVAIVFKVRVHEGDAELIADFVDYNGQRTPLKIYVDDEVKPQIKQLAQQSAAAVSGWPALDGDYPLDNQFQKYLLDCLAKREIKFKPYEKAF